MRRGIGSIAVAAALVAAAAAHAQPAAPGRYDGELCVATQAAATPTCGTADVDFAASADRVSVRVADIVYRLQLHPTHRLDVVTLHGRMQIDEFDAAYDWVGTTLRFGDPAKDVRYEVRIGARRSRPGRT